MTRSNICHVCENCRSPTTNERADGTDDPSHDVSSGHLHGKHYCHWGCKRNFIRITSWVQGHVAREAVGIAVSLNVLHLSRRKKITLRTLSLCASRPGEVILFRLPRQQTNMSRELLPKFKPRWRAKTQVSRYTYCLHRPWQRRVIVYLRMSKKDQAPDEDIPLGSEINGRNI